MAVTDQQLLNDIQYVVIEPPNNGATWPSTLWTLSEVLGYANERQNRLMKETGLVTSLASITANASTGNRFTLPADWVSTVRAAWKDASHWQGMQRTDTWQADYGLTTWETVAGTPKMYMDAETPTLQIQVAPAPSINGTIEIVYVALTTTLDQSGINLTVPDEFAPYIKWGILADMLSKVLGRQHDFDRAKYCEERFQEGILLAQVLVGDRSAWQ